MTKEEVSVVVKNIFQNIFNDANLKIEDNTNANDIEEWDSLTHINLVMAIEKEFKITFALGELESLKDVGSMIDMIFNKLL